MFSKSQRIPREVIKKVLSDGQSCRSELFLIKKLPNNEKQSRFAVVVSKKVAKSAVTRHKYKRQFAGSIKEVINNQPQNSNDFVITVSKNYSAEKLPSLLKELESNKNFLIN
jgi:ribonuclease P protein component